MTSASPRRLHVGNVPLPRLREARDEMTRSPHTVDQENVSATLTVDVPAARVSRCWQTRRPILRSTAPAGSRKLSTGRR